MSTSVNKFYPNIHRISHLTLKLWNDAERTLKCKWPDLPMCLACLRAHLSRRLACLRTHVPKCLLCLRVHMSTCLACLCADVPMCLACPRTNLPCVLTCRGTLRAYMLHMSTCFLRLWNNVSTWLASSGAHMSTCLEPLTSHGWCDYLITCKHALSPH